MIEELLAGVGSPGPGARFWAEAAAGRLVIAQCQACGHFAHPPRHACIRCMSRAVRAVPVSGDGEVDTFTVVRRALIPALRDRVPYVLALVRLREPVRITTLIRGCDPDDVHIGMEVSVAFEPVTRDCVLPVFTPSRR